MEPVLLQKLLNNFYLKKQVSDAFRLNWIANSHRLFDLLVAISLCHVGRKQQK